MQCLLQWVPGHCGLIGNDWVDVEAGKSAIATDDRTGYQGISFRTARSLIIQEISDPPVSHEWTKAVLVENWIESCFHEKKQFFWHNSEAATAKDYPPREASSITPHHSVLSAKDERRLWSTGFRNVRPQRKNAFALLGERRLRYLSWWNHPRLY